MRKTNLEASFDKFKDANPFPGNPFDIHRIQDALCNLKAGNQLANTLRETAAKDIDGAIKLVLDGVEDNPVMMITTVGEELLCDILDYAKSRNRVKQPSPDDLPPSLFQRPGIFGYMGDN